MSWTRETRRAPSPAIREALALVRETVDAARPEGTAIALRDGLIAWIVPSDRSPPGTAVDPTQPMPFVIVTWERDRLSLGLPCLVTDPGGRALVAEVARERGLSFDGDRLELRLRTPSDVPVEVLRTLMARFDAAAFLTACEPEEPPRARKRRR